MSSSVFPLCVDWYRPGLILRALGYLAVGVSVRQLDDAAVLAAWAASGAMALTGQRPDSRPAPVFDAFSAEVAEVGRALGLASGSTLIDPGLLLSGRGAEKGFAPGGQVSANGTCRLLRADRGWWALSLPRDSDAELIPPLLEQPVDDIWASLTQAARLRGRELAGRAAELGLAGAVLGEAPASPPRVGRIASSASRPLAGLLVADLSALWAGPLAGALLSAGGATVVKVEWSSRPDGARGGGFYDWLNHGKLSFAVGDEHDELLVAQLIDVADVVIEASRPRALRQKGLAVEQRRHRPGKIWLRITAHGGEPHKELRAGFGDDAAVAGGLVAGTPQRPVFVGDAIADPLTGVRAGREVSRSLARGGGEVVDVALSGTAAEYVDVARSFELPAHRVEGVPGAWWVSVGSARHEVSPPRRIPAQPPAPALGRHNRDVAQLVRHRGAA